MSRKTFFTSKEVATILGANVNAVQRWAARNGIGTQKAGRLYIFMFKRDDIKRYQECRYRRGRAETKKVNIPY